MEEKEVLKKFENLMEGVKKKKIFDFDGGLLNDVFEPITGNAEEKFDRWSDRLIRVATRLENISKTSGVRPKVLDDIYRFFENVKLPFIAPKIKDDSVTIKFGRTIRIERGDESQDMTCPSELFNDITQKIRQEQFIPLVAQIKILFARAMAELDDKNFAWHKEGFVKEIKLTDEGDNGK